MSEELNNAGNRVRHLGRGTEYDVVATGTLQCTANAALDEQPVVIYRGDDGRYWVRGVTEFNDGRFLQAAPPPPSQHREPIEADREALVGMIAAIIDPDAMKSLEQHKAEWREIVANVHIDPGPRPVDREAIGEKCAQKRFDEQAIYRESALAKAGAILSAHRLAFSTPAASDAVMERARPIVALANRCESSQPDDLATIPVRVLRAAAMIVNGINFRPLVERTETAAASDAEAMREVEASISAAAASLLDGRPSGAYRGGVTDLYRLAIRALPLPKAGEGGA
jgi:hypothetical protein